MNPDEQFDCRVFFGFWLLRIFFSPLTNICRWKFSLTAPPRWYHKQTSVPNVHTVGKGSNALEWAPKDWGLAPKAIWLLHIIFYSLPLKIWVDENLVMPRPSDDIINKRAYSTLDLLWGRGLLRGMSTGWPGAALKANLIVEFFFGFSP